MGSVNTLEQRRLILETQIAENKKLADGAIEHGRFLASELAGIALEEQRNKTKQIQIDCINELLVTATEALKEAGLIGKEYHIDFTFEGPRGEIEFNERWMSSDCYGSNRWYEQGHQGGYDDN